MLMESLFKLTELESRIPMNMNVLTGGWCRGCSASPRRCASGSTTAAWCCCAARASGSAQIEKRLEILRGLLIVYLDLDQVIKIIREEDEPKAELMRFFELTDIQAEAILEHAPALAAQARGDGAQARARRADRRRRAQIEALLGSDEQQWKTIAWEIREVTKTFGPETTLGKRRTSFADAPETADIDLDRGHGRARAGDGRRLAEGLDPRAEGPCARTCRPCSSRATTRSASPSSRETTAKILVLATNGKVYTLEASKLPGGRGFGDPIRLMVDLDEGADIVAVWPYRAGDEAAGRHAPRGAASSCPADDVVANTRKGRQVLNVDAPARRRCWPRRSRATTSRSSARTASCSCFPLDAGAGDGPRQGRAPAALQGWRPRPTPRSSRWRTA